MKNLKTLHDIDLKGKTVVVGANLNVPIHDGTVIDDTKIRSLIPTLEFLLQNNCKVIIASHLGNPKGKYMDEFSLMPIRFEIGRILEKQIKFADIAHCENSIKFMDFGEILLLENLLFNPEEFSSKEDVRKEFVKKLGNLADIYINDAFGVDEKYASIIELSSIIKKRAAGLLMQKELETLERIKNSPESPFIVILGGENTAQKIKTMETLVEKADSILLGNEIAHTFLKASGVKIGKNAVDEKLVAKAEKILKKAKKTGCEIVLPVDHICSTDINDKANAVEVATQQFAKDLYSLDIGPRTLANFREIIESAKTVVWDGPMGEYTLEKFNKGTEAIGEYIALSTPKDCFKIAGGDQTALAINILKIKPKRFNHISIDGVWMLQFIAGEEFDILKTIRGNTKK